MPGSSSTGSTSNSSNSSCSGGKVKGTSPPSRTITPACSGLAAARRRKSAALMVTPLGRARRRSARERGRRARSCPGARRAGQRCRGCRASGPASARGSRRVGSSLGADELQLSRAARGLAQLYEDAGELDVGFREAWEVLKQRGHRDALLRKLTDVPDGDTCSREDRLAAQNVRRADDAPLSAGEELQPLFYGFVQLRHGQNNRYASFEDEPASFASPVALCRATARDQL